MKYMNSEKEYQNKLQSLNATLWDHKILGPQIKTWLGNFVDEDERLQAMHLLSRMMYFNVSNIRRLLVALYRDLYRYPIIETIRRNNKDTLDEGFIESEFQKHLDQTMFLGIGRASESGNFLLYYFRQENALSKQRFGNVSELLDEYPRGIMKLKPEYSKIRHFVFIDDVCGSGSQATSNESNMKELVSQLRKIDPTLRISYYMLFGRSEGLMVARMAELHPKTDPRTYPIIPLYTDVEAVIELDDTYKCFGDNSRYFENLDEKYKSRNMAYKYGYPLAMHIGSMNGFTDTTMPNIAEYSDMNALGFGDCQLLLSMEHNTPDNTLPIIWFDEDEKMWRPIFKRYNKIF